jgi:hypothetical protein
MFNLIEEYNSFFNKIIIYRNSLLKDINSLITKYNKDNGFIHFEEVNKNFIDLNIVDYKNFINVNNKSDILNIPAMLYSNLEYDNIELTSPNLTIESVSIHNRRFNEENIRYIMLVFKCDIPEYNKIEIVLKFFNLEDSYFLIEFYFTPEEYDEIELSIDIVLDQRSDLNSFMNEFIELINKY